MNLSHVLKAGLVQRAICAILAISMAVTPSMNVMAQNSGAQPSAPDVKKAEGATKSIDDKYVTAGASAIVVLRPAQLMKSPLAEMLPVEVATAAGMKYLGVDPANVEEVIGFIETPNYGLALKFLQPFGEFNPPQQLRAQTQPGELAGKKYLKSQHPMLPSFHQPDDHTLLVAPDAMLVHLLQVDDVKSGPIIDRIRNVPAGSDLYVAVDIASLRPIIMMGLARAQQEMPPDARKYLNAVNLIEAVELTVNISKAGTSSLVIHANDAAAAEEVEALLTEAAAKAREQMRADLSRQAASNDPVERAFAQYMERVSGKWQQPFMPTREGAKLTFFRTDGSNSSQQQQLVSVAVIGILVALLLPAVQAAREAARRTQSMNNMKQMMLGLLNYESAKRAFPAHAIYSADGKPLLSWRVQILPYIEEQALYQQFHLDEPWDSEHNRALIPLMPRAFTNPNMPTQNGKTNYLAIVGKECVFDGSSKGMKLRNITDGLSKTIVLVEADQDRAVEWTKPEDLHYDANNPTTGLGHMRAGVWLAAFADGSIQLISNTIDRNVVRSFFEAKDGGPNGR